MRRLGYTRYVAQGGDVGAGVTDAMGRQAPEGLVGIHTNLLVTALGGPVSRPKSRRRTARPPTRITTFRTTGSGYFLEQATRPQTIGYALVDSPVGLAAWMLDHDTDAYHKISRAFVDRAAGGQPDPGQRSRQHHALLADRHRCIGRPVVLGELRSRRCRGRRRACPSDGLGPGWFHHVPRRDLAEPAQLGRGPRIPPSPTSTRWTGVGTSPPGRSRSSSRARSGRRSGRCGGDDPGTCAHAFARRGDRLGEFGAADAGGPAREGRPRRLLDADVHQLAAHRAVHPRLVAGLPGRRARRARRPHARVLVRARPRPRPAGGAGARDRLPGRDRQRLRRLERIRQQLLAGALLRRQGRGHPRPALRRRALRALGARRSSSCSASSASSSWSKGSGSRRTPTGTICRRPRRTSATGEESAAPASRRNRCASTSGRSPATGRSGGRRRRSAGAGGASPSASTLATRISCCPAGAASRFPSASRSTATLRAARTAWTSTRTGTGCSARGRLYQLVRQHDAVRDRTLEITFREAGAEAYSFTFG